MAETGSSARAANLLWTGGWDSTFQLLRLLLDQRRHVRPFYLIDSHRASTEVELWTMHRIRDCLFERYPYTRELLEAQQQFSVTDVASDSEITETFSALRARQFMGRQYEWLARFCRQHGIEDMQLCIHRDDKAHAVIADFVSPAECAPGAPDGDFHVDPSFAAAAEYRLFRCFRFPVLELTKVQMGELARQHGWEDIMNMTWFCQAPLVGRRPCGTCNPCAYTIQEGLGWRLPLTSRARYIFLCRCLPIARGLAGSLLRRVGLR